MEVFEEFKRQAIIDSAMLQSMSQALRQGLGFSFNPDDMADLLDRLHDEHIKHLLPEVYDQ